MDIRLTDLWLTDVEIEAVVEQVKAGAYIINGTVCPDMEIAIGHAFQRKLFKVMEEQDAVRHKPAVSTTLPNIRPACKGDCPACAIRRELGLEESIYEYGASALASAMEAEYKP